MAGVKGKSGSKKGRIVDWNVGRKTSTSKRDRALFIRCTAEERQEIKIKLNILKENLKCQTLVETVLVLIEKEISKNK